MTATAVTKTCLIFFLVNDMETGSWGNRKIRRDGLGVTTFPQPRPDLLSGGNKGVHRGAGHS